MTPAERIISDLGGPSKVSRELGVHRTRVSNWKRPREVGGTGGSIPQKHIPKLLEMAAREGVPLTLQDFFKTSAPHVHVHEGRTDGAVA